MTKETQPSWEDSFQAVTDTMNKAVELAITPLLREDPEKVRLVGTGSVVTFNNRMFILTCRHVIDQRVDYVNFEGSNLIYKLPASPITPETMLDSAVFPIPTEVWALYLHRPGFLEVEQFAWQHDPVPREIFFFRAYSQENSAYGFGNFDATATGVGTQINEDFSSDDRFFYLRWDSRLAEFTTRTTEQTKAATRKGNAHGFSGSLVFDTGFVRALNENRVWSPADARVTGQVVNWDQHNHQLVVRRIEDVSKWLRNTFGD